MIKKFDVKIWPVRLMNSCNNMVVVIREGIIQWVNKKFVEDTKLTKRLVVGSLVEDTFSPNFDAVYRKGEKICNIRCVDLPMKFGRVLFCIKTNGLEEEYDKFNNLVVINKEVIERVKNLWNNQ